MRFWPRCTAQYPCRDVARSRHPLAMQSGVKDATLVSLRGARFFFPSGAAGFSGFFGAAFFLVPLGD